MDILTIKEVADMLGMTRQGVYQAVKRGDLTAVTILGKKGIALSQVRDFQAGKKGRKRAA